MARMANTPESFPRREAKEGEEKGRREGVKGRGGAESSREAQQNGNSTNRVATRVPVTFFHPPQT